MSALVFVDTNVLVYALDTSEPEKQPLARAWMAELWKQRRGRLSYPVLQEYYVTVTRKLDPGLAPDEARREIRSLLSWEPIVVDIRVLENAWRLERAFHLSWWDAQIVAAAQVAECRLLLSEDLGEGQSLGGVEVVNPFRSDPDILSQR